MAKRKPIFTVMYAGTMGAACQPVKADDELEAKTKFLKRWPKQSEDTIFDIALLETDHKHYRTLASSAI